MNLRGASPVTVLVATACLAVPAIAAALLWIQWGRWADTRTSVERLGDVSGVAVASVAAEELSRLAGERAVLTCQVADKTRQLSALKADVMPVDDESVKRQILDMLNAAARCGLVVEEVRQVAGDARSVSLPDMPGSETEYAGRTGGRKAAADFLNRFSAGARQRPLLQLRCRGEYASIRDYFDRLDRLRWKVTPVLFDISRVQKSGNSWSAEDETAAPPPAVETGPLRLSMIVSL